VGIFTAEFIAGDSAFQEAGGPLVAPERVKTGSITRDADIELRNPET